jgi:hypothetical protein
MAAFVAVAGFGGGAMAADAAASAARGDTRPTPGRDALAADAAAPAPAQAARGDTRPTPGRDATAADAAAPGPAQGPVTLDGHIKPVLEHYCVACHNSDKHKGDLNLTEFENNPKLADNRKVWEKVAEELESRDMPPEKKPQPSDNQRDLILKFIDGQLSKSECHDEKNPGRVTIRRLNREEYRNTIHDLMGVNYDPEDFPNDEVGYGFDNIGDVLSLPPMLMEKYLAAADEIVHRAIVDTSAGKPFSKKIKGDKFETSSGAAAVQPMENGVLGLYREGEGHAIFDIPQKAEYTIRVRAHGELAGPEPPKLALQVNDKDVQVFNVTNESGSAPYEARAVLEKGKQKISVVYLNNYRDMTNPDPKLRGDRNVFVHEVELVGPPPTVKIPESQKLLIPRMPQPGQEQACAMETLGAFAARAYRRPVAQAEVQRLSGFVDLVMKNGGSYLEGIQTAMEAALCSPYFLYRWELDPDAMKPGQTRDLNDYEVASRLSYFLWSSMPDAELFALGANGNLRKDGNLEKQVARMIKDWRGGAFVRNFADQWLQIRNIWEVSIDPETFPRWDDSLKGAMKEETELFFGALLKEDRPVTELIDADFTFLNEKLARYYGIEGVKGDEFRRVTLPKDSPRGGVLTQGSVLLATSTPTRTSPVIRGKWILEQILGTPPPPPPPDVPQLAEQKQINQTSSVRQRLEQHRSRPECAGCHAKMDPLGFALENFDATGAWRDSDGKFPIDASGELANGTTFKGPRELKQVLKSNRNFVRSLTKKMMIYALGRGLEFYDKCACDQISTQAERQGNTFSSIIVGIVTSDPFLKRRNEIAKD